MHADYQFPDCRAVHSLLFNFAFASSTLPIPLVLRLGGAKPFIVISLQLEQLLEVRLAIDLSFQRSIFTNAQRLVASGAPQTSLVKD